MSIVKSGGAPSDSLRAHGRRDSRNHAGRHCATDYLHGRPLKREAARTDASRGNATVKTEAGTSFPRTLTGTWIGKNQRPHQPAVPESNLPAGEVFTTPRHCGMAHSSAIATAVRLLHTENTAICKARRWCLRSFGGRWSAPNALARIWKTNSGAIATPTRKRPCRRVSVRHQPWGLRGLIGILLQDEKFPACTSRSANPYGSQTHADWESRTHVELVDAQLQPSGSTRIGDRERPLPDWTTSASPERFP